MSIKPQSLTTTDGECIAIEAIVKYKIQNPKKYLLEVEDAVDAINDVTQGVIKDLVMTRTWKEVKEITNDDIKSLVAPEAKEWGIKISYVTITSLVKARTYKIIGNQPWTAN